MSPSPPLASSAVKTMHTDSHCQLESNVSWGAEGGELGGTTIPTHFPLPSHPPHFSPSTQPTQKKAVKAMHTGSHCQLESNVSWGAEGGELGGTTIPTHFPLPSHPPHSSLSTQPTQKKAVKAMHTGSRALGRGKVWV